MKGILLGLGAVAAALVLAASSAAAWSDPVGTNVVVSSPVAGGGYPVPPGGTKPVPGTCGPQILNANHSESWLAVKPGTEDIVGDSKFFVGKWSTFYDFHLGSYKILNGSAVSDHQVEGYEVTTVGAEAMPASLATHPDAVWTTFNGPPGGRKSTVAASPSRGQTFSMAIQLTTPSATTPANTYVYPSIGPDGTVYVAFVSGFDTTNKNRVGHVYVTKSVDDGVTWTPFILAATPIENPNGYLPPTNFRDGIIENFGASPTYPGHVYLTYENYDPVGGHMDVYFTQSTDGGLTWSAPALVNDDANTAATDQFQPSVAAGLGGAVAVAFYDRRAACPSDASIIPAHQGDANTCINVSLQPYKDSGP